MSHQVELSIPTTSLSQAPKPYTLYNISLRLPLRSYCLAKRYSDFTVLHAQLTTQVNTPPPAPLPAKSWFTRTTSSPELTEQRRVGLEAYLRAINTTSDPRWRNTSAWRTFLNLPASSNSSKASLQNALAGANGTTKSNAISDPVLWLDTHRTLKTTLHDARLNLTKRDQAATAYSQHEASSDAKKCLVRAGTMIAALEAGLKENASARTGDRLADGEARRRKDLVAAARKEREGLETLMGAMTAKAALDRQLASAESKGQLLKEDSASKQGNGSVKSSRPGGRVLGKETDRTRALSNQGVVQLQKQLMQEQDEDVTVLGDAVKRQKELAVQIQEELEVQNDMLGLLDEDVDRVQGKIDIARKRVGKIS